MPTTECPDGQERLTPQQMTELVSLLSKMEARIEFLLDSDLELTNDSLFPNLEKYAQKVQMLQKKSLQALSTLSQQNAALSPMQMRFFFFPWYEEPGYRESSEGIIVSKETQEYLDYIEIERQRKLDEDQRRWYEMKQRMLGDAMKQEYPSTPKE